MIHAAVFFVDIVLQHSIYVWSRGRQETCELYPGGADQVHQTVWERNVQEHWLQQLPLSGESAP